MKLSSTALLFTIFNWWPPCPAAALPGITAGLSMTIPFWLPEVIKLREGFDRNNFDGVRGKWLH